eukprot:2763157-Amphidinium_carterae.1
MQACRRERHHHGREVEIPGERVVEMLGERAAVALGAKGVETPGEAKASECEVTRSNQKEPIGTHLLFICPVTTGGVGCIAQHGVL